MQVTTGEEGNKPFQTPLVAWIFLRRRVNPRTASGGGVWRRRVATVPVVQKAFLVIPDYFGAIFVILKLFNVFFV